MAVQVEKPDPNGPKADMTRLSEKQPPEVELAVKQEGFTQENSIYAEVQAAVPVEDVDVPVNTVRVWILGIITTIIMSAFTQLFNLHNPPVGKLLARCTPKWSLGMFGRTIHLNPGPFSYKEHTIIAIMAIGSTGYNGGALATYVWTALVKKLDIPVSTGFKLMFLLTTQGTAFGLAGIFQKLLVDPAHCIWPTALPTCTLIHGMHNGNFLTDIESRWKIRPIKFFWVAICIITAWHFVPGFLFTGLSYFAWITWIAPTNVTVNHLFGAFSGMDLFPITLDWNQITAYQVSPLVTPAWAVVNVLGGVIFFLWIVSPALHWSNIWYGKYFPFSSAAVFDNTGQMYDTARVLTPDLGLNTTAYHDYSPIYLSTTSAVSYGLGFGAVVSVVVHAALYYRSEIWFGLKKTWSRQPADTSNDDIHVKLMRKYAPTPTWWYGVALLVMFGFSIWFAEGFGTGLPWWGGVILGMAINLLLFVPNAILAASCNQNVSTNVFSALLGGYIWPGKMVAVVVFKCLNFNVMDTGLILARDQKLGHYMKIPPRVVFCAQALGIIVNWLTQTGVNAWALASIKGVCTPDAIGKFTCPISSAYQASIVFWGTIGPAKLFSNGAMYQPMLWFFPIGAILPVMVYFAAKKFPRSFLTHVNVPLIMSSTGAIPPATANNFMTWGIIGIIFQWYIRRRAFGWWQRYNFLLSAALDGGLAFANFLIFFCIVFPGVTLSWWGNNVESTTADYAGQPLLTVPEGQTFGPKTWL